MEKPMVNVVRFFTNSGRKRTLHSNVPLDRAKLICSDSEGSSQTCKLPKNKRRTRERGPWFVGYKTIPVAAQIKSLV